MDLETLRALVAFADADCNLTRAGKNLGLSQPAVHARLAAASASFGAPLYERRGRRLALTDAGVSVLGWAQEVVAGEKRLRAEMAGAPERDQVVVACGEGALVHVVAPRLAALAAAEPGLLAFRVVHDGASPLRMVAEGKAQLAVTIADLVTLASTGLRLASRPLQESSLLALSRFEETSNPRRNSRKLPPISKVAVADLLAEPLLLPPRGKPLRERFEELAQLHRKPLRLAVEVSGWEAVVRLAELGVGVGIVNDVVLRSGLHPRQIVGVPSVVYRTFTRLGRLPAPVAKVLAALEGLAPAKRRIENVV